MIVITTNGIYMWSSVPPSNDGWCKSVESMISNILLGLLASVQTEITFFQTQSKRILKVIPETHRVYSILHLRFN